MAVAKILRIYLDNTPRARAERGEFNIINKIQSAFEGQGFRVDLNANSEEERRKSATRNGYSLFHMDDPFHANALTMRKAYFYPFWRIENSAKRWEWEIARTPFDPDKIDAAEAKQFCDYWRRQHFGNLPEDMSGQGYVYVPLQGRLLEKRSFQHASPISMIKAVLRHDEKRNVFVGLHPGETYLPEEIGAIAELCDEEPRLMLSDAPMKNLLIGCDYVVAENSSVVLSGFFLGKPAALFAEIDFNHLTANVGELGIRKAIKQAPKTIADYDKYLCWFLRETAINGGSEHVEQQILNAVRHHGWQI